MNENKIKEETENIPNINDLDHILPAMNVAIPSVPAQEEHSNIISDDAILEIYGEILNTIRQDRAEVSDILNNFCDMVMNEGDSSSASKEAIVNLVRAKLDSSDKMAKVADLMTRVKLKERDTFPRYLNAKQENTINIGDSGAKSEMLRQLNKAKKKKEGDKR